MDCHQLDPEKINVCDHCCGIFRGEGPYCNECEQWGNAPQRVDWTKVFECKTCHGTGKIALLNFVVSCKDCNGKPNNSIGGDQAEIPESPSD